MTMKRNPSRTPDSVIVSAMRRLWLRSRERSAALKRAGHKCEKCGRKFSRAKGRECVVEVHHIDGTQMKRLVAAVRECLLHDPSRLRALCRECHAEETARQKEGGG